MYGKNKEERLSIFASLLATVVVYDACRCSNDLQPAPPSPSSVVPVPTIVAPSASSSSPPIPTPAPLPDEEPWKAVEDLGEIEGSWGVLGGVAKANIPWVELRSREVALRMLGKWDIPYPWRITVGAYKEEPFDCGLFESLHEEWRVGFCLGGNLPADGKRVAHQVGLFRRTEDGRTRLRVTVGDTTDVVVDRL